MNQIITSYYDIDILRKLFITKQLEIDNIIRKYILSVYNTNIQCHQSFNKFINNSNYDNIYINNSKFNISRIYSKYGRIDKIMWLKSINYKLHESCFDIAAKYGHSDLLMFFKNEFPEIEGTCKSVEYAAENGNNEILLLIKNEFPNIKYDYTVIESAAKNGHSHTLLLFANEFNNISNDFWQYADLLDVPKNILYLLLDDKYKILCNLTRILNVAICKGYDDIFMVIYKKNPYTINSLNINNIINRIFSNGHDNILRLLYKLYPKLLISKQITDMVYDTCDYAAKHGYYGILNFINDHYPNVMNTII